jgi:ParB family chromosome partitioning protein
MGKEKNRGYELVQVAIKSIELLPVFAMRDLKDADVDGLAESIKTQGLINPVLVRPKGTGWELICGHRRYLAFCKLKAPTIPAHVIDATDEQAFVLALTENIERRDPTPMEDASAFKRAMDTMHMKPEAIAKQVGRSPSWVLRRVQLLELEPRVQAAVQEGTISATMAEEGFLKLKHQGDQLELFKEIKQQAQFGRAPTAKAVEASADELVKKRAKIEALAKHLQQLGDKLKFPKCPKCGNPPASDGYSMDLRKNKVQCSKCYEHWDLVKGSVRERETTLDGNVSGREKTVPGGESVVKVESKDHLSNIAIQDYFDHLAKLVTKAKAATMIQIGEEFGDDDGDEELSITFKVDRKKLPKWPTMVLTPPGAKKAKHATDATLQVGGWGGDNEGVLEHRTRLWDLEKAIDAKVTPAGIARHELERLVVDHIALSKGKVLETTMDNNTVYEVLAVHRDYTAIMQDTTHDATLFMEEKEVRAIVKNAKKAAKKGG